MIEKLTERATLCFYDFWGIYRLNSGIKYPNSDKVGDSFSILISDFKNTIKEKYLDNKILNIMDFKMLIQLPLVGEIILKENLKLTDGFCKYINSLSVDQKNFDLGEMIYPIKITAENSGRVKKNSQLEIKGEYEIKIKLKYITI